MENNVGNDSIDGLVYKILVIGDSSVGKTSLTCRYVNNEFNVNYNATIGIDCKEASLEVNGIPVRLKIWDTAGQERFRTLTTAYYRGADAILLMYDITSLQTFEHLDYWLRNIELMAPGKVCIVILGNKKDLSQYRQVEAAEGKKLADNFTHKFFETSCKTGENVAAAFFYLALNLVKMEKQTQSVPVMSLTEKSDATLEESFKEKSSKCSC